MQMFYLVRDTDVTGVSGTGIVAEGCLFDNGHAVITWMSEYGSTVVWAPDYDHSAMEKIKKIHGHDGATRIVWTGNNADPAADKRALELVQLVPEEG